jgi:hypothetical protein
VTNAHPRRQPGAVFWHASHLRQDTEPAKPDRLGAYEFDSTTCTHDDLGSMQHAYWQSEELGSIP